MNDTAAPQISTYLITAEHPDGRSCDIQLIATSPSAAISRARGTLTHRDRDLFWMDGTFTIVRTVTGTVTDWI